jgi:WD40 repeat protein
VRAWALATGAAAAFIPHPDPVTGVAVSPDGGLLASAALDGTVRVFDLRAAGGTPALLAQFNDGAAGIAPLNGGSSLAFSPDNRLLAVGGSDGFARLWVIASGELLAKLPHGAGSQVLAAAFSLDGSVLATGGGIHPGTPGGPFLFQDTTLYLWDVAALQDGTGAMAVRPAGPWRLDGHLDAVTGLAFSANGTLLVSIGADGTFRLWGVLS